MPEGHTIHALAQRVDRAFAGQAVALSSPQGRFEAEAALLDGAVLERAEAWGKHLFLTFADGRTVHVHLGLFGRFSVQQHRRRPRDGGLPDLPVTGQVRLRMLNRTHVGDLRGPTACALVDEGEIEALLGRLGPDPLRADADVARVRDRFGRTRRPLHAVLLDQSVVAGVGNVYRSEILHRLALDPFLPANRLPEPHVEALWEDLRDLLPLGVTFGRILTTPADVDRALDLVAERDLVPGQVPVGAVPRLRPSYAVYRRTGRACPRCGDAVRTALEAARNLFWCPSCQVSPGAG